MGKRIVAAALLGGLVMFFAGAFEHMALQWEDRAMKRLADEATFMNYVKSLNLSRGIYAFPEMPLDTKPEDQERVWNELNEKYKGGPNGWLLLGPTGEDMMGPTQLGGEYLSNALCALLAAWIVSLLRPNCGFAERWRVVMLIGLCSWLGESVSMGLWYRFPIEMVRDQLLCTLLEWGLTGLVIAGIVRPAATEPRSA